MQWQLQKPMSARELLEFLVPLKIDHPVDRKTKEVFNGCDTPNGAHQTIEVNLVGGVVPGSSLSGVSSHGRRGGPKF